MNTGYLLLVLMLGADDFSTREAAHQSLAAVAAFAMPEIELCIGHPDPEIARRCRELALPQRRNWLESFLHGRKLPWLDALPKTFAKRQDIIDEYVFAEEDEHIECCDRHPYRDATARWLRDWVANGATAAEVMDVFKQMEGRTALWLESEWRYSDEPGPEQIPPPAADPKDLPPGP